MGPGPTWCVCVQGVHGVALLVLHVGELQRLGGGRVGHRSEGLGGRRPHGEPLFFLSTSRDALIDPLERRVWDGKTL